ncbi:MAG: ribosome silencing factor [Propionibacteriaceae bacterium]|nr:ribosome silencing factor [Propionibacteriaceae bacterium]
MSATARAIELAQVAGRAASTKLAHDIVAFDVSGMLAITDVFLIATAANERQAGAIVDAVDEALLPLGVKTVGREGERDDLWVLLDYGDLVVHVQQPDERQLYSLERLWKDAPRIPLVLDDPVVAA